MGNSPNVVPVCTMNTMKSPTQERDTNDDGISSQHEEEKEEQDRKKKKRKSRSTSSAVVEFLDKHSKGNETKEKERIDMLKRMHDDKMEVMNRFLTIMETVSSLNNSLCLSMLYLLIKFSNIFINDLTLYLYFTLC